MHLLPKFATITKIYRLLKRYLDRPLWTKIQFIIITVVVVDGGLRGRSSIRKNENRFSNPGRLLCCCFAYTKLKSNLSLFCSINNSLSSCETLFSFMQSLLPKIQFTSFHSANWLFSNVPASLHEPGTKDPTAAYLLRELRRNHLQICFATGEIKISTLTESYGIRTLSDKVQDICRATRSLQATTINYQFS